jgi:putative Holliday junction resolvase
MRFLGLDYGAKRWGLSFADELGLAVPLPAALAATVEERFAHLAREIAARRVTDLVVGYPFNMDGSAGPAARAVDAYIAEVERRFRLPVHRADERLTSHQAEADARAAAPHRARAARQNVAARRQAGWAAPQSFNLVERALPRTLSATDKRAPLLNRSVFHP